MRIALAQINPIVGDIDGNASLITAAADEAVRQGADLVATPELAVFGYPPKDLLCRQRLVERNVQAVQRIASHCRDISIAVGYVEPNHSGDGHGVFNAVALCRSGEIVANYRKILLPTYDVFDEGRYFDAGRSPCVVPVPTASGTCQVGLTICEDLWNDEQFGGRRFYGDDPIERTVAAGAQLLLNLSASPFRTGVCAKREGLFVGQVREHRVPLIYVNQVGGNDDLIFDGASLAINADGTIVARARAFDTDLLIVDLTGQSFEEARVESYPTPVESMHDALVLGIRDYLRKCGFNEVVLGLSGGIDSAVTAALTVQAIEPNKVHGVAMPSRFSTCHSLEDAQALAKNLGIQFAIIDIKDLHAAYERALAEQFRGTRPDVSEENIQARVRGNLLMALSNKFNRLLLTTGNKSELAVGYCTLYGDMCGGLAVLSDVPKTQVYELARLINRNAGRELIPQRSIDKPPSAELREYQTDQDSLPPYKDLDVILEHYVERDSSVDEIAALGFDKDIVTRVAHLVDRSEYKRKQIPVGIKVTTRAFGTGRRMPIAARYS